MIRRLLGLLIVIVLAAAPQAFACSVCFGNPASLQAKALNIAVLFLLGTVGMVLAGIIYCIILWSRRAQKLTQNIL